jgi:hypothetical protein
MATCEICNDGKVISRHGLKIHMGKIHGVHYGSIAEPNTQMPMPQLRVDDESEVATMTIPVSDIESESESSIVQDEPLNLVPCGHPFCQVRVTPEGRRAHWDADHSTWLMSNGKYVFEAVE